VMLGMEPTPSRLITDPVFPPEISELALRRVKGRWPNAEAV
jgi:hypothetical protein